MKLRIAAFSIFCLFGTWGAYGQSISPAQLPNSSGCSLPFASATNVTCVESNQSYSAQLTVNAAPAGGTNPVWSVSSGIIPQAWKSTRRATLWAQLRRSVCTPSQSR